MKLVFAEYILAEPGRAAILAAIRSRLEDPPLRRSFDPSTKSPRCKNRIFVGAISLVISSWLRARRSRMMRVQETLK